MKDPMPGFTPVNFRASGKIVFVIGVIALISGLAAGTLGKRMAIILFYLGISLIVVSLYLIFVVPRDTDE